MLKFDFDNLKPDDTFRVQIEENVWLMDDHRWAMLVWELLRKQNRYSLVHADFHWDGCDDFYDNEREETRLLGATLADIEQYVVDNKFIRFDSFIAPAVRRGMFEEIHFFCKQDGDKGLRKSLLKKVGAMQFFHRSASSITAHNFSLPVVFDLCLDLFNRSEEMEIGNIWPESKILHFLNSVRSIIASAEIVTVSLSFGYSGSEDDTRRLAKLVVPFIASTRSK